MTLLTILEYPDPRLRTIAKPVEIFDARIHRLVDDMIETMYEANGVGLAATQVNVHEQVIVIDVSEERNEPQIFINPSVSVLADELRDYEEGCLSVPGFHELVSRPENIEITAFDQNGKEFKVRPDGLLAVCIQHEMDHLNGKLFVDYLSNMKRQRIRKKLEKQHKLQARA